MLAAVDSKPKRLVISVRQAAAGTSLASEAEVSGSIGTNGARVSVPDSRSRQSAEAQVRKGDDVARARVFSSQSAATDRGVQTVQVMEGNVALIRIGQSIPVRSGSVIQTPQGLQIYESVEYRDVDTGFRVRPRVHGDQVTLEISLRNDTVADANAQVFDTARIDSVISGRLGQWMEVGGVDQNRVQTEDGTISRRTASVSNDSKVFLKVELVP